MKLYQYKIDVDSQNWKVREGLILQCGDNFGEIAPLPGFSRETLDEARAETFKWLHFKTPPTLPSVQFGIACAQRPLRSIQLPLCALGPREGFSTVKLKLGHLSLNEAISFTKEHLGRYRLRLDCNRSWSLDQALEFTRHFKKEDFVYLEEPVKTFDELISFSQKTQFPLAVDESIHCDWSKLPSLKALVVKPTVVGHIPSVPPHLDLVLSSAYESGLGLLHIAHMANNSIPIGLDTYRALKNDLLIHPIQCKGGTFSWNATNPPIDVSKLCAL